MPIAFIPFEAFVPDGGDYGPNLAQAENMLPVFGSWRPLNEQQVVSTNTSSWPVNGAHVHIYQQARAIQYMRADTDSSAGTWAPSSGSTLAPMIDEVTPSDTDFIFTPNAPAAATCKIGLSNPTATPGVIDHYIRWRYRIPAVAASTPSWEVKIELLQGATVIASDTATGSAVTGGWVQREYNLTGGEIAALGGSYNDLYFRFTGTNSGIGQASRPSSDISVGSWTTNADAATNLYQQIDETPASSADYIKSPTLPAGGAAYTYVCGNGVAVDPVTNDGFVWRYEYRGANAGVTLVARLKQVVGSTVTLIKETTHTAISTSFVTQATALTTLEAAAITDFGALRTEFVASYPTMVTSTMPQYARPVEDRIMDTDLGLSNTNGWINDTTFGTTNLWTQFDEVTADDLTTISPGADIIFASNSNYTVTLSPLVDPQVNVGHILRFRWKRPPGYAAYLTVRLWSVPGGTEIAEVAVSKSALPSEDGFTTVTYTLTAAEADAIINYANLYLEFINPAPYVPAQAFQVSWAEFEVPTPRRAEVSFTELELQSQSRVEVSWAELEVPDSTVSYQGDVPTIIAGTKLRLYEVGQASPWTDISKGGADYASGLPDSNPAAWSICSWGNHVVATNYIDQVQYRAENTGLFADLITSVEKPKARFCAPFKSSLLLGGINLTNHYDDEVWWSAAEDIRDFHPSITTQADYQRLTSCPGQVMGLVGGDFALVFKRRSIHALDYVGGATIVRVRDVSASIGTTVPRSIVSAVGSVYFWGGSSFYRTDGYSAPQRFGDDTVSRYLRDADFSDGAVVPVAPTSIIQEDSVVNGWYDPAAGLIFWQYQGLDDSQHRHSRLLVYNPSEDRWSHMRILPAQMSVACQKGNTAGSERFLLKGTVGFNWGATADEYFRFSGGSTYTGTFTTKRQAIAFDENDRPLSVRIRGVLPVISTTTNDTTLPNLTVTAAGANDIRFLLSLHSETYGQGDTNEAGWFPHDVTGSWFYVTVEVPSMSAKMVTAFKGVYVNWELRGRS